MKKNYAQLSTRIKAAFVDSVVLITLMYSASEILNLFDTVPNYIRIVIFTFLFLLYEPILVSIYGATIGHFFNDIVVKSEKDETQNIIFPKAILRYILKFLLGWISFLTISGNEKKQAIHDLAAKSIVKPYEKLTK
ncbi:putative RDD family membrane protein YckC [Mariniflexile fucanivorans]|uniref:Putative RDD family membrane protein YckC n=1 Tax=Mariniflexile fucanivorans TaxID=264023 RepID=A0A4R1RP09_9FLAO|nr:RDD family protein [Mariniflexile fucanivorans]TCL67964.1 putative RDD family membrane protein YckC [Mariniflexile fucanivorans]